MSSGVIAMSHYPLYLNAEPQSSNRTDPQGTGKYAGEPVRPCTRSMIVHGSRPGPSQNQRIVLHPLLFRVKSEALPLPWPLQWWTAEQCEYEGHRPNCSAQTEKDRLLGAHGRSMHEPPEAARPAADAVTYECTNATDQPEAPNLKVVREIASPRGHRDPMPSDCQQTHVNPGLFRYRV